MTDAILVKGRNSCGKTQFMLSIIPCIKSENNYYQKTNEKTIIIDICNTQCFIFFKNMRDYTKYNRLISTQNNFRQFISTLENREKMIREEIAKGQKNIENQKKYLPIYNDLTRSALQMLNSGVSIDDLSLTEIGKRLEEMHNNNQSPEFHSKYLRALKVRHEHLINKIKREKDRTEKIYWDIYQCIHQSKCDIMIDIGYNEASIMKILYELQEYENTRNIYLCSCDADTLITNINNRKEIEIYDKDYSRLIRYRYDLPKCKKLYLEKRQESDLVIENVLLIDDIEM